MPLNIRRAAFTLDALRAASKEVKFPDNVRNHHVAHFEAYFAVHVVNFPSTHSVLFLTKVAPLNGWVSEPRLRFLL